MQLKYIFIYILHKYITNQLQEPPLATKLCCWHAFLRVFSQVPYHNKSSPSYACVFYFCFQSKKLHLLLFLSYYFSSLSRSFWILFISSRFLGVLSNFVSSAKLISVPFTCSSKSVIQIVKNIEPLTDPYGTPLSMSLQFEKIIGKYSITLEPVTYLLICHAHT